MNRNPRKDRARKKRLRRRNAAWAERTAAARYSRALRRLYMPGMLWYAFRTRHQEVMTFIDDVMAQFLEIDDDEPTNAEES